MPNQDQQDSLQLSKKERKFFRRQQEEKERLSYHRQKKLKKFLWITAGVLIIGGGIFGGGWWFSQQEPAQESEIISRQGIHWHADLSIKILGKFQEIPANIGIGVNHRPLHTHETDSVIHMEFNGLVRENDIRLGKFFEIWGKKFNKDCIFNNCSGLDGQVKMLVNGELNSEFENYIMRDGDKIEIVFD